MVQLLCKSMPYYDNFWYKDVHESIPLPASLAYTL